MTASYKSVAELLADPARWCQGCLARDATGQPCSARSTHAVSFCLLSALYVIYRSSSESPTERLYAALPLNQTIAEFNDHPVTTHAAVLALVRSLGI